MTPPADGPDPSPPAADDHWGKVGPARAKALAFYRRFVAPGDLVFDVGANVGNRTELFLELRAEVVAFEPQPSCATDLAHRFGTHPAFTLLRVGLGASPGVARLLLARDAVLATTSDEFVAATSAAGRFAHQWTGDRIEVRLSTLDTAIEMFGVPTFVKIDVEGAEPRVLAGLGVPVPAVSFEFAHELIGHASDCVARLDALAQYQYAFSEGESLVLSPWMAGGELLTLLTQLPELSWGDVYARVVSRSVGAHLEQ